MLKAVIVFLVLMAGVGMLGNALFPGAVARRIKARLPGKTRFGVAKPANCKACGRYVIGSKGCDCGKKG